MQRLKRCPFCGGKVSIALCGDSAHEYWIITRGSGQMACKCRLFMESELFDPKDKQSKGAAKTDLINVWNRRTSA